jgi:hypothetical protein
LDKGFHRVVKLVEIILAHRQRRHQRETQNSQQNARLPRGKNSRTTLWRPEHGSSSQLSGDAKDAGGPKPAQPAPYPECTANHYLLVYEMQQASPSAHFQGEIAKQETG